jgi:hypothetical protein
MRQLIIDSSDRVDYPTSSASNFTILLTPAVEACTSASLVFASIASAADSTDSYYLLSISGFGVDVRTANIGNSQSSFVIPILAPAGYRTIYNEYNNYSQSVIGSNTALSQINVRLHLPDGTDVQESGSEWFAILRLD